MCYGFFIATRGKNKFEPEDLRSWNAQLSLSYKNAGDFSIRFY